MTVGEPPIEGSEQASAESAVATPAEPAAETEPVAGKTRRRHGRAAHAGTRTASSSKEVDDGFYGLDFGVHKTMRYHQMRRGFLDNLHRAAMASAVVSATTAYSAVTGTWPQVSATISVVAAIMTMLDVVVGLNQLARTHESLYRRFSELAARMARVADPTEEQVRRWRADRLMIEADERPPIESLNMICHNMEADARGLGTEHKYRVSRLNRAFAQFFTVRNDFPP
jgi:hypothetical protein